MDLSRSRAASQAFSSTSLAERSRLLSRLRKGVLQNAERLADVVVDEGKKVRAEALVLDVAVAAMTLSWAATAGPRVLATSTVPPFLPGFPRRATSTWRPRGVCALLSPWNYPLAIPMGTIAAALAGGNAIVWKPSEHATRAATTLLAVLREAGLPHDLLVVVEGGADAGRARIESSIEGGIDHVTFVGSTAVGRKVAARCGERLVPCIVELGGKAPAIVCADADVERAARAIVFGGLANGGQSCVAVERVYASSSIFDRLLERTRALSSTLRPGVELGRPVLADKERALQAELTRLQAKDDHGIVDVTGRTTSLLDDECFGAVVAFVCVADDDEAVGLANAHPLQLAAYVFGSAARARAVAARLRAPMVAVDDTLIHYALPQLPFGGVGASGFGRVHGDDGLRALCVEQILVENTLPVTPSREPWWQPYDVNPGPWLKVLDKTLAVIERLRRR